MFKRVLIANRGEIAVRLARTLREMSITSVAVFSDADVGSPHVALADEAFHLPGVAPRETYLDIDRLVAIARNANCEAIIPGYGFLSENPRFVEACDRAGLIFVGPSASAIALMGDKLRARATMQSAGVPVVPGGKAASIEEAAATAKHVGYPVFVKAAAGGGGKGMRLVHDPQRLVEALERAQSEARVAFGDATVYIEKAILNPRHVEIQVLGDQHGNVVHLFERDCSIQRRHQKVLEETPAPHLSRELVERMAQVALAGARAVNYYSAGTFEFLVDTADNFYFMEMNTRLQVEHPVTEMITGIDLVGEMLRVAAGEPLGYDQSRIGAQGAAIECRVYAEDPQTFLPTPGRLDQLELPQGPFVRNDVGVQAGSIVSPHYDPLLGKLCVWAPTRPLALQRLERALGEYAIGPVTTNLSLFRRLLREPAFIDGRYTTALLHELEAPSGAPRTDSGVSSTQLAAAAACLAQSLEEQARRGVSSLDQPTRWARQARQEALGNR